jgi:16S rRNA (cytidine1402-2'-O)-methyltransferase
MIRSVEGILYIVATPIGNPKDITYRAAETLRQVDAVVCEELRPGSTLLKKLEIQKPLILLNEHNDRQAVPEILHELLSGRNLALISDCGTPVFADPGRLLLVACGQRGIRVVPVPGPASLMAALSVCKFDMDRFVFGGFLSRDGKKRREELFRLQASRLPIVLMDAPYRLTRLLEDVVTVLGSDHPAMLACDLTLPGERVLHGTLQKILEKVRGSKCEFILVLGLRTGFDNASRKNKRQMKK